METIRTKKPFISNTVITDFEYFGSSVSDSRKDLLRVHNNIVVMDLMDIFIIYEKLPGRKVFSDENAIMLFMFYIEYLLLDAIPYYLDQEEITYSAETFAAYTFNNYTTEEQKEQLVTDFITYNMEVFYTIGESLKQMLNALKLTEKELMPYRWNTVSSVTPIDPIALKTIELVLVY